MKNNKKLTFLFIVLGIFALFYIINNRSSKFGATQLNTGNPATQTINIAPGALPYTYYLSITDSSGAITGFASNGQIPITIPSGAVAPTGQNAIGVKITAYGYNLTGKAGGTTSTDSQISYTVTTNVSGATTTYYATVYTTPLSDANLSATGYKVDPSNGKTSCILDSDSAKKGVTNLEQATALCSGANYGTPTDTAGTPCTNGKIFQCSSATMTVYIKIPAFPSGYNVAVFYYTASGTGFNSAAFMLQPQSVSGEIVITPTLSLSGYVTLTVTPPSQPQAVTFYWKGNLCTNTITNVATMTAGNGGPYTPNGAGSTNNNPLTITTTQVTITTDSPSTTNGLNYIKISSP